MKSKDSFLSGLNREIFNFYNAKEATLKNLPLNEQIEKIKACINFYTEIYEFDKEKECYYDEVMASVFDLVSSYEKVIPEVFEDKHEPWLDDVIDSTDWIYSDRYNQYLFSKKNWDLYTVNSIGKSTNIILDHCGNPKSKNKFHIKGLVIGDIQSGKTANYTSLINKAIDTGYKFIIVLAGQTKDLRSQTQKRLDKEVVGYQTMKNLEKGRSIGVGTIKTQKEIPPVNCLTDANLDGDLRNCTLTYPLHGQSPLLVVVKKNQAILQSLINFIKDNPAINIETNKISSPVLVIDDEADQASLNTSKLSTIEKATTINKRIRTILSYFDRYTYIGYTATPFANAFIDPFAGSKVDDDGKDIFPEDFIITLKTPDNYSGVNDFFGDKKYEEECADGESFNLDLFRPITCAEVNEAFGNSADKKAKVDDCAIGLPDTMIEAIKHFLIVSAIKIARGINEHSSMLIHISHFVTPTASLKPLVIAQVSKFMRKFDYKDGAKEFKQYWEEKIKPISQKRLGADFNDKWEDIETALSEVFNMLQRENCIVVIGGKTSDTLDYDSSKSGIHIVIGGNKLSRGLTLEGLVVSYYYRGARAYDTLLQMGRWFGYREGWLDLCRIYTTYSILNDFISSAEALEMFKSDIKAMNKMKYTPKQFGLKVATSPKLVPTSASKMRTAKKTRISFSGDLQQTISFNPDDIEFNRNLTLDFLSKIGPVINRNGKYVFENVDAEKVLDYLEQYKQCQGELTRISTKSWIEYIKKLNERDELVNWTIILHSLKNVDQNTEIDQFGPYIINKPRHTNRNTRESSNSPFAVKVITNPADFLDFYDIDNPIRKEHTCYDSASDDIRQTFTPSNALLTIYDFDITKLDPNKKTRVPFEDGKGVIGLGLWFPISNYTDQAVDYYINNIYQQNGYHEIIPDDTEDDDDD